MKRIIKGSNYNRNNIIKMDKLTDAELETVKRFYELYMDQIPDNKEDILAFIDSLSPYDKEKHFNDDELEKTVSEIVDSYFKIKGRTIYPFGGKTNSFVITDGAIDKRKYELIEWIKKARNEERCNGHIYRHYDGGACATSDEMHSFYCYVFNHYYESIGTTWEYT